MSLDDLTCEVCGMRYGDVALYREHVAQAHQPGASDDPDTQPFTTGMPTGSTVREDIPPPPDKDDPGPDDLD